MQIPNTRQAFGRLKSLNRFYSAQHKRAVIQELFELDIKATVPPRALSYIENARIAARTSDFGKLEYHLQVIHNELHALNPDETDNKDSDTMNLTNAALLIRDDITTCQGVFSQEQESSDKQYTFILHNSISAKPGDLVAVHANNMLRIVRITNVNDECCIDPNDSTVYKWVIQKVDPKPIRAECQKTATIANKLKEQQRRSVRDQVLAQFGVSNAQELLD